MGDAPNPYATPKAVVADGGAAPVVEAVRREHLNHEANIQAAGGLYMLGAVFAAFAGFTMIASDGAEGVAGLLFGLLYAFLTGSGLVVGWGLRVLRTWARTPGIVLAIIGLLAFPIGTLINAYVLWLLASRKGRMVLSAEYAAVVEATPHIRYRTSIVVWIALGVIVLLIVLVLIGGATRR